MEVFHGGGGGCGGGITDAGHARSRFPPKRESQPPRRRGRGKRSRQTGWCGGGGCSRVSRLTVGRVGAGGEQAVDEAEGGGGRVGWKVRFSRGGREF